MQLSLVQALLPLHGNSERAIRTSLPGVCGWRVGRIGFVSQCTAAADLLLFKAFKDVKSPIQLLVLQETKPRGHYHYKVERQDLRG